MARGISYHFGIHTVDDDVYPNWPDIESARYDAEDLCAEAAAHGFEAEYIDAYAATRMALQARLAYAAQELEGGDMLLLTFSGHGRRIKALKNDMAYPRGLPGCSNPPNEVDGWDESLLLYDGLYTDNEFYRSWCHFRQGVRIVIISDCCETGTLMQMDTERRGIGRVTHELQPPFRPTTPPPQTRDVEQHEIPPIVLLLSASQDDSRVTDKAVPRGTRQNGAFTSGILAVWRDPMPTETYATMFERACVVAQETFALIRPAYTLIGSDRAALEQFENETPFSIGSAGSRAISTTPRESTMSKIKVQVYRIDNAGQPHPIVDAPVILFHDDMTIRSVGFTKVSGECKFLDVVDGNYILMVIDAVKKESRIVGVTVAGADVTERVAFEEGIDKGKMIVTVTIGATSTRRDIQVNVFDSVTKVRVAYGLTDDGGVVQFDLAGTFDVEAINFSKAGCRDVEMGVGVPVGNVVVPVLLDLPANC